ncbi:chromosomal replication initiator protein DnaA [Betaproteobacteria bacterium]|nr:chromosomal replication initiator protein DnaA [Betaproteobacteria bacterium]GHU22311.1 chromosomal replication initiator protein DnaA [Betaproteobacteria bacterium]GHU29152.1 chromosomal replication initiator protein DnaA [Betaproteobacteria bacterium]
MPQTASSSSQNQEFWPFCLERLAHELSPQKFKLWIKPLELRTQPTEGAERQERSGRSERRLTLLAQNDFVLDMVRRQYLGRIGELGAEFYGVPLNVELQRARPENAARRAAGAVVPGGRPGAAATPPTLREDAVTSASPQLSQQLPSQLPSLDAKPRPPHAVTQAVPHAAHEPVYKRTRLIANLTFDTLVTGQANNLARAAAEQVAQQPGTSYNPLFIYGGVGLGKTHLAHAIGNVVFQRNPRTVIRYVHSEDFSSEFVRAIQNKKIDEFKRNYRALDLLILDDIQFLGTKEKTKEEFFHIFNALTEAKKQIVITCDTYPKNIENIEDRLVSRFDWGLTVQIEVPDLEMRAAILKKKAEALKVVVDDDVAFFIAKNLRSNVRELEGALNKVVAHVNFTRLPISLELVKEALKDLLPAHNRQLSIELIQKTVADYYRLKVADMHSQKRTRVIARPRQVAMWLARELTPMSLPAIGAAFGRDHTTVMSACKAIIRLRQSDEQLNHDVHVLTQTLRG